MDNASDRKTRSLREQLEQVVSDFDKFLVDQRAEVEAMKEKEEAGG